MFTRAEKYIIIKREFTKFPHFSGRPLLTVQVNNGGACHQFIGLEQIQLPLFEAGDVLEISIIRKRTTKTWLGRLWDAL